MIAAAVLALLLQAHPITLQPLTVGTPDVVLPSASVGIPFYTVKVLPGAAVTTVRASAGELVDGGAMVSVSAGGAVTFRAISGAWYVVSAYSTAAAGGGTPASSVVTETAFGQASAVGTSTDYARGDHTHGTPTITDADVPNNVTIDLAALATTASAGDSATGFFPAGVVEVVRGGTGSAPGGDDQVLVSDSAAGATWRTIPPCNTATEKTFYNPASNTWTCEADAGGAGAGNGVAVTATLTSEGILFTVPVLAAWVATTTEINCRPHGGGATTVTPESLAVAGVQATVANVVAGNGFDVMVANPYGLEGDVEIHCIAI